MKFLENLPYGHHPDQILDLYLPEECTLPTFVYFHGGGFESDLGKKEKGRPMAEYLAARGAAVVCSEYRKYPEASYPDFLKDCAAAAAWAYRHLEEYGCSTRLCLGGSSAGGYASMMLCFDRRWLAPHKLPADAVIGYFHDAGQPTTHFNVLRERGFDPKRVIVDDAAPLYHIGELTDVPPMHFVVSDHDIENRYEQTMLVLSTMKHLGYDMSRVSCEVRAGKHCAYIRQLDEEGLSVFGQMVFDFLKKL